jgi:hypothetical protein
MKLEKNTLSLLHLIFSKHIKTQIAKHLLFSFSVQEQIQESKSLILLKKQDLKPT